MLSEDFANARAFPETFRENAIYMKRMQIRCPWVNLLARLTGLPTGLGSVFLEQAELEKSGALQKQ